MKLEKEHNPRLNAAWIDQLLNDRTPLEKITRETEQFFTAIKKDFAVSKHAKRKMNFTERLWSLFAEEFSPEDEHSFETRVTGQQLYPAWKERLDAEYRKLESTIQRRVNVRDYGAVGDGKTDCTEAFNKAFGKGVVEVKVPAGIYMVDGLRLPSWTRLIGAGKGQTVLKLQAKAPRKARLLTNSNYLSGNRNVSVEGLTLDWHVERLGDIQNTSAGGNYSSCLTYARVTYGWVKDVEALNPGLHCFDITSPLYNYAGDGLRGKGGSRFVWLDGVSGSGFGDDGLTTHHSDYIFVSNSHFSDPSGRAHDLGFSNSNGFEVDDGSRYVWLSNNSSTRCFGGVEIKAHANSSAASGVHISGHLSVHDNRSFNFRHIGHHKKDDPESQSAFNILAQRLVSIEPIETPLYEGSAPRCLVVSGYRNVAINRFLFVGDPDYDYKRQPAAAIQYRAGCVSLTNGVIRDFTTAGADVSIAGGEESARNVRVQNLISIGSAEQAVAVGKGSELIYLESVRKRSSHLL
ncbi:pectate lyase [Planococcus antarcticus DSM 14505]|uniref:Pectate lyase n=1 Tax=Planococcus antarcticus DSM 14505 TaxID=1185653 RepID=A0ABN4RLG9_9BACL|nr:glycosyl hydrolase family 28-related protein [Planococcus antarcticus]ANU11283.1 pectate lyase [Planococcus antarcticus DSM 14505]